MIPFIKISRLAPVPILSSVIDDPVREISRSAPVPRDFEFSTPDYSLEYVAIESVLCCVLAVGN